MSIIRTGWTAKPRETYGAYSYIKRIRELKGDTYIITVLNEQSPFVHPASQVHAYDVAPEQVPCPLQAISPAQETIGPPYKFSLSAHPQSPRGP